MFQLVCDKQLHTYVCVIYEFFCVHRNPSQTVLCYVTRAAQPVSFGSHLKSLFTQFLCVWQNASQNSAECYGAKHIQSMLIDVEAL